MTEPEHLWFTAACPYCGNELTNLKVPRALWGGPGSSGSTIFSCSSCEHQVAAREERGPGTESRLVVSMHTLPAGAAMPSEVIARQVDAPPASPPSAPAQSIDEMFERIVKPWQEANRDASAPDFAALATAVESYQPKWQGVAWQDVGRHAHELGLGPDPTGWTTSAQCYVEALRHNSDPNFLGWHTTMGGYVGPHDPPRDPEADALNERISARALLDDAGRAQLVEDLRRYVGAPGEPGPRPS